MTNTTHTPGIDLDKLRVTERALFERCIKDATNSAYCDFRRNDDYPDEYLDHVMATWWRIWRTALTRQTALGAPTERMKCDDCDGRGHDGDYQWQGHFQPPEPGVCNSCGGSGWADPAPATQQAGVSTVKLEAFKGADTKQWHIVVNHPFGTSWVKMNDPRDTKLAELLAASPAATTASASIDSKAEFLAHLQRASDLVETWPEWKRGMFESDADRATAPSRDAALIKTWQERMQTTTLTWRGGEGKCAAEFQYMADEIDDLRAILARQGAAQASHAGADTELADVLNTTLWLYRRLPQAYGNPPFVDKAILKMAERLGLDDVPEAIKERAAIAASAAQDKKNVE